MRQGLAMLINQQQDMQVCGEAEEAQAVMQAIAHRRPDIMILDISLSGPDGLELLKSIRASDPDLPVLILSMHDEAIYAERALRARANGYIMKQEATEKVLVAMRRILNGDIYLSDRMSNKMLQQYIGGSPSMIQSRIASLSDRELEVFRLIGEGRATREIAEELHLSIKTVETYQAHLKEKLSLRSGRELIQHAIQWKINEKTA
jgi:DNA-binding NarL/FixJ family response regulator